MEYARTLTPFTLVLSTHRQHYRPYPPNSNGPHQFPVSIPRTSRSSYTRFDASVKQQVSLSLSLSLPFIPPRYQCIIIFIFSSRVTCAVTYNTPSKQYALINISTRDPTRLQTHYRLNGSANWPGELSNNDPTRRSIHDTVATHVSMLRHVARIRIDIWERMMSFRRNDDTTTFFVAGN